ncbi:thiol:disulfide interchange protein DsbA [Tamilnaduibacter salinus]|uniref:Thiol:disulfide interchange protein n=1 Tax=Tamilnaduibacter salinus TaxID=1484056 RepID=A0A2A2I2X8_9GAMM|nr:thiol:disulfide interchange protein DsbA/DsbL [Tamilnaduibacter salinus]PAV25654.1 disulfide bond formation protein DsbA [Tamilnaduibacter salinus]PVY76375.1 thiol:disulfide interchange protein DsbA [Tamilnaduibacter salinus]
MAYLWKGLITALMLLPLVAQAQSWESGTHYQTLDQPLPTDSADRIQVTEVFWYGCPHCYSFKPHVESWEQSLPEDVRFRLMPAILGQSWEPHARAFYALKALDALGKAHSPLFEALAGERRPLNSASALGDFLSGVGVDPEAFVKAYDSFGVNARLQQSQSRIRAARITGVPTMLVNGRYKVTASMAGGQEKMLDVVDYLIEKERQAQ